MIKKFLTSGIIAMILFFSTAFCYAAENTTDSNKMNLGDELTNSMNKIEKSASNLTDNIKNDNTVEGVNNKIKTDYNATRTSINDNLNNTTGMNGTTWIWIVLAVIGIVILATVWFYATQNSGRD